MTTKIRWTAPVRYGGCPTVTGLLTVLAVIWCGLNLTGPWGPPVVGWALPLAAFVVLLADVLRLVRSGRLTPGARRFWLCFGLANATNTAGVAVQAYYVLTGRSSPADLPRPTIALFLVGVLMLLWALLGLPVGVRSRTEWVRLILDGATVMVASALFAWRFAFESLLDRDLDPLVLWGTLGAGVLLQLAVAAVVKVVLAGSGPIDAGALRILGLGLFAGSLMASVSALLTEHTDIVPSQLVLCPLALVATLSAARQRRAASAAAQGGDQGARPRRPVSLLPYAAVGATQVLLVSAVQGTGDPLPVVLGAVVVTCLVVARQWGAFRDVERLLRTVRRQEERLRHRATHDPLTQLANRTLLGEQLEATLDDPARGSATVLLIDLDNFKTVNDSLGHAVGDELLVTVAGRLKACVRSGDLVCRLGGDEFVILLADVDTLTASHIAQRIVDRLAEPVSAGGHTLTCNASLGIAAAEPGDGSGRLLSKADIAMYAAKRAGKSSFTWYDASADVAGQNTESTAAAHPTPAHR